VAGVEVIPTQSVVKRGAKAGGDGSQDEKFRFLKELLKMTGHGTDKALPDSLQYLGITISLGRSRLKSGGT